MGMDGALVALTVFKTVRVHVSRMAGFDSQTFPPHLEMVILFLDKLYVATALYEYTARNSVCQEHISHLVVWTYVQDFLSKMSVRVGRLN